MAIGDFLRSRDIYTGDCGFVKSWDFYPGNKRFLSLELRIFQNLGIFISGIGHFIKSEDYRSRGLQIFQNVGIFMPGIGNFLKIWVFYPRDLCQILGIGQFSGIFGGSVFLRMGIFMGMGHFKLFNLIKTDQNRKKSILTINFFLNKKTYK